MKKYNGSWDNLKEITFAELMEENREFLMNEYPELSEAELETELDKMMKDKYPLKFNSTEEELLYDVNVITKGERFITGEQMASIMELPGVYCEDCGLSGTGKGTLYTLYVSNKYGDKTDTEICEVVELK